MTIKYRHFAIKFKWFDFFFGSRIWTMLCIVPAGKTTFSYLPFRFIFFLYIIMYCVCVWSGHEEETKNQNRFWKKHSIAGHCILVHTWLMLSSIGIACWTPTALFSSFLFFSISGRIAKEEKQFSLINSLVLFFFHTNERVQRYLKRLVCRNRNVWAHTHRLDSSSQLFNRYSFLVLAFANVYLVSIRLFGA